MANKVGRPETPIDWEELDKLCAIQCTLAEIAGWFKCSVDTIQNKVNEEKGMNFSAYYAQKSSDGKISLRRSQYNMALKNPTLAIWLGKNWLDQSDKNEVKQSNVHSVNPDNVGLLLKVAEELIALKKNK